MNQRLKNKRALVTGGSRGTGAAIVKRLACEGAYVALTYVSKPGEAGKTAAPADWFPQQSGRLVWSLSGLVAASEWL